MLRGREITQMTDEMVYTVTLLPVAVISWGLGMWGFLKISQRAKIPYTGPSAAFRIYKYAFEQMKGSRETKMMVLGFAGMFVLPLTLAVVLMYLLPLVR
jgi:hypothetical protein